MFAESADENSLAEWLSDVQALRYKDFRCVAKPALAQTDSPSPTRSSPWKGLLREPGFHETESVSEFARKMEDRGVVQWWKKAMGYTAQDS
jgi:hypothetical protein